MPAKENTEEERWIWSITIEDLRSRLSGVTWMPAATWSDATQVILRPNIFRRSNKLASMDGSK
jgi:hypothetical protein